MSLATSIRNCTYVTTTREHILDKNTVFTFEEEHSHATTNKLYFSDFDKFNQVIDDNSKQKNGSGLGLTITKHLIGLHGGEIYVESKVGEGSEFIIILPVNNN